MNTINEKLISFNREDFTEDTWDILCSEFECSSDTEIIMRVVLLDEDDYFDEDEE